MRKLYSLVLSQMRHSFYKINNKNINNNAMSKNEQITNKN